MKRRILTLILSLSLMVTLIACGGSEETVPPTTVPPTTTEPAPDARALYDAAADGIRSAESMVLDYTIDLSIDLGGDTYLEQESTSVFLSGIGTDSFAGTAASSYTWGPDYYADTSDVFLDGVFYGKVDDRSFSTEMTGEDYLSRYLPVVLLSAELYETVEMKDANTVSFSDAAALEPWLARDGFVLEEAAGSAYIDDNGELENCSYLAVFSYGQAVFRVEVTFRATTGPVTVEAPADTAAYVPMESPDAALAYERAIGMALQAGSVSSTSTETILVEAGAALLTQQCTMNSFGTGADLMATFDTTVNLLDLSSGSYYYEYTLDERFENGVYTIAEDDGPPAADSSVDAVGMRTYCQNFCAEMFPYPEELEDLTLTDLGGVLLLEYTFTEESAKSYTTSLCGAIYEDENLLNDLSTDYRTETACGYVGIDPVTGLPLSLGIEYLGIHTIEGTECRLIYNHSQNLSIGTGDSYKEITGSIPPAQEPESQATPLLYRVTGDNGEQMWLFGTIHVGDSRTAYLPQTILDAFAGCDALAVEFDSNEFEDQLENDPEMIAQLQQHYFYSDGSMTSDHIQNPELYEAALQLLKATGGYNANVEYLKPVLLANTIENSYLDLGRALYGVYGADNRLMQLAREQDKEILSVESGLFQIGMLTGYSDALQEQLLLEAVASDPREYQEGTYELYELWCSGDEAALIEYLNAEEDLSELTEEELVLYEEYWDGMSTQRNADMLEVAKSYLSGDQTVFYAVGLAHLLAEDGLVNTLRDAGYTVELVPCA